MNDPVKIFLENDKHSQDVLLLVDAIGTSFEKLAPLLSKEAGQAFGEFMLITRNDVGRYLETHIAETVKEITNAKNN